jgi:hypothetical protein
MVSGFQSVGLGSIALGLVVKQSIKVWGATRGDRKESERKEGRKEEGGAGRMTRRRGQGRGS